MRATASTAGHAALSYLYGIFSKYICYYFILANSTDFGGSLPIFKAIYSLLPGEVNATNYKSTAFASLNVGKYVIYLLQ